MRKKRPNSSRLRVWDYRSNIFAPLASLVLEFELHLMVVMAVAGSIVATFWKYFYNILFDRAMLRLRGAVQKTVAIRVLQAFLFKGALLLLFLPVIAWYLNNSLREAFKMDIARDVDLLSDLYLCLQLDLWQGVSYSLK